MSLRRGPIAKILRAGLAVLIAAGVAFNLWERRASAETSRRIQASESYWRAALKAHVYAGEKGSDVVAWLRTQVPEHSDEPPRYYPASPPVEANPGLIASQKIDEVGWNFACDFWIVQVDVELDQTDRVAGWKVSTAGMCL